MSEAVMDLDRVDQIIDEHHGEASSLIQVLLDVQSEYHWLSKDSLDRISERLDVPLSLVQHITTFYKAFSLEPRGKHICTVCMGTACHVRNAPAVADELERQLGVQPGETTEDREFSFETVNCLGACALGPVVVVDGHYFPQVTTRQVEEILDRTRTGLDRVEVTTD